MAERYPGYDVLSKRDTPSWNAQTRAVVDHRLSLDGPGDLNEVQWRTLQAIAERIVPQPENRPHINTAAIVAEKISTERGDGYRRPDMPRIKEAWLRGLDALETEARARGGAFVDLSSEQQDVLLRDCRDGKLASDTWAGMPSDLFFSARLLPDVVKAYYAHPTAWSIIGFGGPASPRGYVRLESDMRDPWEAIEAKPGEDPEKVRRRNAEIG